VRTPQRHYLAEIHPHVAAARRALADLLDTLDPAAWATPSLCARWTVRDVVAHLTLSTETRSLPTLLAVARARGDLDGVFERDARARAAEEPAHLVARLRAAAGSRHRLRLSSPVDPLNDLLVHGQDIARPLGIDHPVRRDRVLLVLDTVWATRMYGASRRFAGLRVVATDADWATGEGPEVHGPVAELLLVATGRAAGLAALGGPGAAEAVRRAGGVAA
jgi:uncharacterized protein (TIGR03083 family)